MVQKLSEMGGELSEMDPKWLEFAIVASGIVTGLGAVLLVVGQLATAFSALAGLFAAGGILAGLGATIAAIALPVAAIAAAVALLAVAWSNDWGGIQTTLTRAWGR